MKNDKRERDKYDLGGPDPIRQAIVAVVLFAAFLMAIEGLVYEMAITSLIPPGASFSWPSGDGSTCASPCAGAMGK